MIKQIIHFADNVCKNTQLQWNLALCDTTNTKHRQSSQPGMSSLVNCENQFQLEGANSESNGTFFVFSWDQQEKTKNPSAKTASLQFNEEMSDYTNHTFWNYVNNWPLLLCRSLLNCPQQACAVTFIKHPVLVYSNLTLRWSKAVSSLNPGFTGKVRTLWKRKRVHQDGL